MEFEILTYDSAFYVL